jgi:hypothetical protein
VTTIGSGVTTIGSGVGTLGVETGVGAVGSGVGAVGAGCSKIIFLGGVCSVVGGAVGSGYGFWTLAASVNGESTLG